MIPEEVIDTELEVTEDIETTKTYKLSSDKIQGNTNELGALEQAVYKELSTEKYEYSIYSFDYGIELENLIGKDATYVKIELKRRIEDCLLKDERVVSVDNFRFSTANDNLLCAFDVVSIYGEVAISKEVNV